MSLLVSGARKIVHEREQEQQTLRRAKQVAKALFDEVGDEGIAQRTLIERVRERTGVSLDVASYVVDELRATGEARRDRHSGKLFHTAS